MTRNHLASAWFPVVVGLALAVAACTIPAQPAPAPPKQETAAVKAPEAPKPTAESAKPAATAFAAAPTEPRDWPKRAITFIVPWAAGGGGDFTMRLLASFMEKQLGVPVEVVNRAGAGSQIGVQELASAKPDGHTIGYLAAPNTHTLYLDPERKAAFNAGSFAFIGMHSTDPEIIAVRGDSKYKTMKDLVDDAVANPEKVKAASTGILSDDHIAILQLEQAATVKFATVQMEGGSQQNTALLGGHVDVIFGNVGQVISQVKSKDFRILAALMSQRSTYYPDAPTAEEQGYKLYGGADRAIAAPTGTPKGIIQALENVMAQASKDSDHLKRLEQGGHTIRYMNAADVTKWWKEQEALIKPLVPLAQQK